MPQSEKVASDRCVGVLVHSSGIIALEQQFKYMPTNIVCVDTRTFGEPSLPEYPFWSPMNIEQWYIGVLFLEIACLESTALFGIAVA